jgi:hypothetical protein
VTGKPAKDPDERDEWDPHKTVGNVLNILTQALDAGEVTRGSRVGVRLDHRRPGEEQTYDLAVGVSLWPSREPDGAVVVVLNAARPDPEGPDDVDPELMKEVLALEAEHEAADILRTHAAGAKAIKDKTG